MTKHERGGLGRRKDPLPPDPLRPDPPIDEPVIKGRGKEKFHLLIPLYVGGALILGGASFLFINSPSIEMICRQVGNCQRFKEDANKAQDSFKRAEDSFKTAKSLQDLIAANKSIDEAKNGLLTIPDSATELVPPISEQKAKITELDKKIAIALALEQNADKALKQAISKITNADQLNRKPQEAIEPPENAKVRLNKPKAIYVEAQILLQGIPDDSFVASTKKERLKQLAEKVKDLDGKLGAVKALDPCVVNPDSCKAPVAVDPCVANPAACNAPPPPNPCDIDPSACLPSQPQPTRRPLFGPGSSGY
jgi:hypothetical protein